MILTFVTVRMLKAMQANPRILVAQRRLHNQQDSNITFALVIAVTV